MAIYKAITSGNADNLSIWEMWDGSSWVSASLLPSVMDDLYTNINIVTITTSQNVKSYNRGVLGAPYNIIQGGQFQITGNNSITLVGDSWGSTYSISGAIALLSCINRLSAHTNKLTIIGNQNGGIQNNCLSYYNDSTSDLLIIGNQNGGSGQNAYGIYLGTAPNNIEVIGVQNASSAFAIYNITGSSIIKITGSAYASVIPAIYNTVDTSQIIYEGNIYNNLGVMAIRSMRLFLKVTPTTLWRFSDFDENPQYLYGAGATIGLPTTSDVRAGIVYGANDDIIGTLAVPPKSSVVSGVPTDDGVGNWAFDANLITRLSNCATVESVGEQLEALI